MAREAVRCQGRTGMWLAGLLAAALALTSQEVIGAPPGSPQASSVTAAVLIEYQPDTAEIAALKRVCPPVFRPSTQVRLSYYSPLAQNLDYSITHAGPDGSIYLPANRKLNSHFFFSLKIGDEKKRLLIPDAQGVSLSVFFIPGKLKEEWVWPDGIALQRTYFQSANFTGIGIRFLIQNKKKLALNGLRMEMKIDDPEISEEMGKKSEGLKEEDDEIITDPRTSTLYLHDWMIREETWLALGWSPEGGLISGSEYSEKNSEETSLPLSLRLETPARDLEPAQSTTLIFWITWGEDRDTVARSLDKLRKYSGFSRWEEDVKNNASSGVSFHCNDPYLTYLFTTLKAWLPWMVRSQRSGQLTLSQLTDTHPVTPGKVYPALFALLASGKAEAVKNYLAYWLGQPNETIQTAYTVMGAYQYFLMTRDRKWLSDNIYRLRGLLDYLIKLDRNGDGLPEYQYPSAFSYQDLFLRDKKNGEQMQLASAQMITILAFKNGARLFEQLGGSANLEAKKYLGLARKMEIIFQTQYWDPRVGSGGYYLYSRFLDQAVIDQHRDLGAIEMVRYEIGESEKQEIIFRELWNNANWRTPKDRYRVLPKDDISYPALLASGQQIIDFSRTQEVLLTGLLRPAAASEAVNRLRRYAREVVLDPKIMAFNGQPSQTDTDTMIAELNLYDLMLQGLGGLVPTLAGLKVKGPSYKQDLDIEIRRFAYAGALINLRVKGPGGGKTTITVNGRQIPLNAFIPAEEFYKGLINIRIDRFPKKEPSRFQKKSGSPRRKK